MYFIVCKNAFNLDQYKVLSYGKELRGIKWNHFGSRRKCWLPAFTSFPTKFPKTVYDIMKYRVESFTSNTEMENY